MKKVLLTATVQSHIAQFHRPLAEVLHELGYEIHVAAYNNLAEKNGLEIDFVDKIYDISFSRTPIRKSNVVAYLQLKKIIQQEEYDVIHCNTPMGGIITRLAAINARKKGAKVIYTAHGFHFFKGSSVSNWVLYYPIEKIFSHLTDVLITINTEDYNLAKKKFNTKCEYIHGTGVDENRYKPINLKEKEILRREMGYANYTKVILCVGELNKNKNQIMAIRMMKEIVKIYPDCLLLIAGNGPYKEYLEKEIKSLRLEENVKLIGYCTNLEKYQQLTDLLVTCSCREGLGLNVIEALLSGNPVVASLNRGHKDLIVDNGNGFLVEKDDYQKMANCVRDIFTNHNASISDNVVRSSVMKYTSEQIKRELKEIYMQL